MSTVLLCGGILLFCCYLLYLAQPLDPPSFHLRSSLCSDTAYDAATGIHDICSLAHCLGITSWTCKECHFREYSANPEPAVLTPWSLREWMRTSRMRCATANIHQHLMERGAAKKEEDAEEDQFTLLINTWRRNECLLQSVEHYLRCPAVAQIRVIWSDPIEDVPDELVSVQQSVGKDRLAFDEYKDDKLTNRYKWNDEWRTEAIFQTDDDIKHSCGLVTNTFKV